VVKLSRIRLCVNTPAQKAAVMALKGPQNHIVKNIEKLKQRRDFAWRRLNEIRNISCVKPDGAFYLFPHIERASRWRNDKEFVLDVLKETGVLFVHGSGFSAIHGADHFRAVFLPPIEILNEAFDRLDRFMSKHSSE
ncbi:MAG: alanine aminotransferase, partial [Candidatus Bathyarchaeia archaeon]